MYEKYLSCLTWEEVSEYIENRNGLIIPVGICEQHSKHLPLNTDTLIAEYMSLFLSRKTGFLIAPSINYSVALPCDRFFTGTSNIDFEVLKSHVKSIIDWWKLQGFRKFFVLTAHGDPFHIKALKETGHNDVYILNIYDIELKKILEKQECAKHAGEVETSVMMYLYPEKVRKDKIEDFEIPFDEFRDYLEHRKDEPISDSPGCQGYPSYANREKGKKILELMKNNALEWITEIIKEY